jgi:hypothetical protein
MTEKQWQKCAFGKELYSKDNEKGNSVLIGLYENTL